MQDPNRKDSEPKIALSPPALFALAAVIFFLAGGIFAYVQLIGRGLQRTTTSASPFISQDQATPFSTPSSTPTTTPVPTATPTPIPTATPTPETTPTPEPTATPAETPSETPAPSATESSNSEPHASVSAQAFPTVKNDAAEEAEVRKEVLARVDLLKELSQKERDYLYAQVERARGFTKLAIIPFPSGKTRPEQFQIDHLLGYLQKPEYQKLYEDPTVVFVVAGYADKQGNESQNQEISKERAQLVAKILETQAKIANTIRAVGMGGSEFFGHGTPDKNRVVEIWLAAP
jgi:outer membrane protein OmpA-like peptidoglycan-associated protein